MSQDFESVNHKVQKVLYNKRKDADCTAAEVKVRDSVKPDTGLWRDQVPCGSVGGAWCLQCQACGFPRGNNIKQ